MTALLQLLAPSYSLFERDERTRGAGSGGDASWPPPEAAFSQPKPLPANWMVWTVVTGLW